MALFDQISKDIFAAMKAQDKVRLQALRNIKKYFLEAKTAPGANDELTDDAALKILVKLSKQGRDAAALYTEKGRADLAAEEAAQAEVIESHVEGKAVRGATRAEGKTISEVVKRLLS